MRADHSPDGERCSPTGTERLQVPPGLAAAGFQEMRPVLALDEASKGDAVTGIHRADSANEKHRFGREGGKGRFAPGRFRLNDSGLAVWFHGGNRRPACHVNP